MSDDFAALRQTMRLQAQTLKAFVAGGAKAAEAARKADATKQVGDKPGESKGASTYDHSSRSEMSRLSRIRQTDATKPATDAKTSQTMAQDHLQREQTRRQGDADNKGPGDSRQTQTAAGDQLGKVKKQPDSDGIKLSTGNDARHNPPSDSQQTPQEKRDQNWDRALTRIDQKRTDAGLPSLQATLGYDPAHTTLQDTNRQAFAPVPPGDKGQGAARQGQPAHDQGTAAGQPTRLMIDTVLLATPADRKKNASESGKAPTNDRSPQQATDRPARPDNFRSYDRANLRELPKLVVGDKAREGEPAPTASETAWTEKLDALKQQLARAGIDLPEGSTANPGAGTDELPTTIARDEAGTRAKSPDAEVRKDLRNQPSVEDAQRGPRKPVSPERELRDFLDDVRKQAEKDPGRYLAICDAVDHFYVLHRESRDAYQYYPDYKRLESYGLSRDAVDALDKVFRGSGFAPSSRMDYAIANDPDDRSQGWTVYRNLTAEGADQQVEANRAAIADKAKAQAADVFWGLAAGLAGLAVKANAPPEVGVQKAPTQDAAQGAYKPEPPRLGGALEGEAVNYVEAEDGQRRAVSEKAGPEAAAGDVVVKEGMKATEGALAQLEQITGKRIPDFVPASGKGWKLVRFADLKEEGLKDFKLYAVGKPDKTHIDYAAFPEYGFDVTRMANQLKPEWGGPHLYEITPDPNGVAAMSRVAPQAGAPALPTDWPAKFQYYNPAGLGKVKDLGPVDWPAPEEVR